MKTTLNPAKYLFRRDCYVHSQGETYAAFVTSEHWTAYLGWRVAGVYRCLGDAHAVAPQRIYRYDIGGQWHCVFKLAD